MAVSLSVSRTKDKFKFFITKPKSASVFLLPEGFCVGNGAFGADADSDVLGDNGLSIRINKRRTAALQEKDEV